MTRLRFETPMATIELCERDGAVLVTVSRDRVRLLEALLPPATTDRTPIQDTSQGDRRSGTKRGPETAEPEAENTRPSSMDPQVLVHRLGYRELRDWAYGRGLDCPYQAARRVLKGLPGGTTPEARAFLQDLRRGAPVGPIWTEEAMEAVLARRVPGSLPSYFADHPSRVVHGYLALLGYRTMDAWGLAHGIPVGMARGATFAWFHPERRFSCPEALKRLGEDLRAAVEKARRLRRRHANGAAHGSLEAEVV